MSVGVRNECFWLALLVSARTNRVAAREGVSLGEGSKRDSSTAQADSFADER
jgi:hypothetical protein